MREDTIFALASGQGRAGIAVLRLSGEKAAWALTQLAGKTLVPRHATPVALTAPESGDMLDFALALWFPKPASFTGEAVVELHLHGGPAVVGGVLESLSCLAGLRSAEPGEFTRRAFENGKLDLTEIEGLADLVEAETAGQRRQALRQFDGALRERYESWRDMLLGALARVEAAIDFADEELPVEILGAARTSASRCLDAINAHLDDGHRGERLREGLQIVLLGAPNAGKSTLLNALAQRDAAIVSDEPGTTRDVVEIALDLDGFPVTVCDTAGLRKTDAPVEREGVLRAHKRAADADLRLALFDGTVWPEQDEETLKWVDENTLVVLTKIDVAKADAQMPATGGEDRFLISAKTGDGMDALLQRVKKEITTRMAGSETAPLTRLRHRAALGECVEALARFLQTNKQADAQGGAIELAAEDLRLATRALGRLTGRVDVEDVLDRLFAEFCIGK